MNELITSDTGYLIKCSDIGKKKNDAELCFINPEEIYKAVNNVINMDIDNRQEMIAKAYSSFEEDTEYFKKSMKELLSEIT